jgi:mRNA interferase MazF
VNRSRRRITVAPWQVWWVDFDPQVGHEQAGRRPAIVVGTALACSLPNGLALLVPCTSTDRGLPIQPPVVLAGRPGFAQCDQVRALSTDRLVSRHAAGTITKPERQAIAFALRSLINVN